MLSTGQGCTQSTTILEERTPAPFNLSSSPQLAVCSQMISTRRGEQGVLIGDLETHVHVYAVQVVASGVCVPTRSYASCM